MGFINIGVNQAQSNNTSISTTGIGTSSTGYWSSSTNGVNITIGSTYTTSTNITVNTITTNYHILGEDFKIEGFFHDSWLSMQISQLNTYAKIGLAKVYYEELKKNNIIFPDDIDKIIQKRLLAIERDIKINSFIDEK